MIMYFCVLQNQINKIAEVQREMLQILKEKASPSISDDPYEVLKNFGLPATTLEQVGKKEKHI